MSVRVITIDKNYPQHWDYAKSNGFWDLQFESTLLHPGDDVFFWVTGTPGRVIGRATVTTPIRELHGTEPHAWDPTDPRRGEYTHRIGLDDFIDLDETIRWGEVRAATGAGGRLNPVTAIPDRGRTWFEWRMGVATADPFEAAVEALASDTYWERMDVEVMTDDRRERIPASVVIRRGQRRFRDALLAAFDRRCAVTGCSVVELLEAAHISPYKGDHTDRPDNGLLLRSDIHTLFDLDLLTIRATDLTVAVAPVVDDPLYQDLEGRLLRSRGDRVGPNRDLLAKHNGRCVWLQTTRADATGGVAQ